MSLLSSSAQQLSIYRASRSFIYLFLAALGPRCWRGGFSLVAAGGSYSLVAVHRLLTAVASLWSQGSRAYEGFSSWDTQAKLLRSMWDLPKPEIKPVSPALADGFLIARPPRKSPTFD